MSMDKPRSKKDIKGELSKRETDKKKRLKDAGKVAKDKKTEADTARNLRLGGTKEGADAVKKAVKAAANETDNEHKKQSDDLDKQVFQKAQATEKEMQHRGEQTKTDIQNISKAIAKIDTKAAKQRVNEAKKDAGVDRKFLDDSKKTQEKDRKQGQKEIANQKKDVQGAKIGFKS